MVVRSEVVQSRITRVEDHRDCIITRANTESMRNDTSCLKTFPRAHSGECRESLSLFSTFTHVMKADADSQEKLLKYICDTLERVVLHGDHHQVNRKESLYLVA